MFNLTVKDFLIQKNTLILFIPIILMYIFLEGSLIYLGYFFSVLFIIGSYYDDEKDNNHILMNSLPYTRKEIVSSKYMTPVLVTLFFIAVIYLGNFIINRETIFLWREMLLVLGLVMFTSSFLIPFSYKFKMQHLFVGMAILVGLYMVLIATVIPNLNDRLRGAVGELLLLPDVQFYLTVTISAILIYGVSYLLSLRIYRKKAF